MPIYYSNPYERQDQMYRFTMQTVMTGAMNYANQKAREKELDITLKAQEARQRENQMFQQRMAAERREYESFELAKQRKYEQEKIWKEEERYKEKYTPKTMGEWLLYGGSAHRRERSFGTTEAEYIRKKRYDAAFQADPAAYRSYNRAVQDPGFAEFWIYDQTNKYVKSIPGLEDDPDRAAALHQEYRTGLKGILDRQRSGAQPQSTSGPAPSQPAPTGQPLPSGAPMQKLYNALAGASTTKGKASILQQQGAVQRDRPSQVRLWDAQSRRYKVYRWDGKQLHEI